MTALLEFCDDGVDAEIFRRKILANDENRKRPAFYTHVTLRNRLLIVFLSRICRSSKERSTWCARISD